MLSARARMHLTTAARGLPHTSGRLNRAAVAAQLLNSSRGRLYATNPTEEELLALAQGPMTPLTIFATSPPPERDPSTYLAPATVADGATLDFRLSFCRPKVNKIKEDRFKEEMGVFMMHYERPYLQEYKNILEEKKRELDEERKAARKASKLDRKTRPRKKTLFELEQDNQRRIFLDMLRYPKEVPELSVKGTELKRFFHFMGTQSPKEIYKNLYPDLFGDTRERIEQLVPRNHDPYVWEVFFDPENPDDFPNQDDAEENTWEDFNTSPAQQIQDALDEMHNEQERDARQAAWTLDPDRFKGKWTPRDWPKEDLDLSRIKSKARTLQFLRDQLKKHGLMPEHDESEAIEMLKEVEGKDTRVAIQDSEVEEGVRKLFGDDTVASAESPTQFDDIGAMLDSVLPPVPKPKSEEEISALLDEVLPNPQAAPAPTMEPPNSNDGQSHTTISGEATGFAKSAEAPANLDSLGVGDLAGSGGGGRKASEDNEGSNFKIQTVDTMDGELIKYGNPRGEEIMKLAKEREARLNRLKEHVPVPFDKSPKENIFADELTPGRPVVEFIHAYSLDPSVAMGTLARREFLQRKVVLKVYLPSLSLPPVVNKRFVDLVGSRYDSKTGWLKLVGDKHPNRHLNQKYLKLLMRELINESFLADSRYTPLSDLKVANPSSLRRKYTLPDDLQSVFDGTAKQGGWAYKMFKFQRLDGRYPAPQETAHEAKVLRQRLSSVLG